MNAEVWGCPKITLRSAIHFLPFDGPKTPRVELPREHLDLEKTKWEAVSLVTKVMIKLVSATNGGGELYL